jgi:alcohol dehydrogenase (cytochrome c)
MMRPFLALVVSAVLTVTVAARQSSGPSPAQILKPSPESWPTFHGDYSGRHYSTLDQIDKSNVKSLSLAWTARLNTSLQGAILGGNGPEPAPGAVLTANIKATPLLHSGMLYLATPNNAYALDARTGRQGLIQQMSNTPITYMLDGTQYVLVGAGDTLYAFSIQR